ncbi:trimethylguanosine synthase-like [Rhopalosiphum padi]|uniref:trimethylguanosine synthase-like n=1 Tax=Rhopalosiphum padi TaxID=40932 RepID=UPI00298EAD2D|nr:trimethylguanosine synthase-like [Rhopalosiphum padi]
MRYTLFSNFDRGIILDEESFYSVCPEVLSHHIAKRCKNNTVVDPFCGAGGNIIQLAKTCKKVIAIDIDPEKIKLARHNAEICGVADNIEFIVGDFFIIYPTIKADVLFMSPPWGGPGYSMNKTFSLESMCKDHWGEGFTIFDLAKRIAPNIAFHLPKNTNILELLWLARSFGKVEIQQNIINEKLNSLTAFYGSFNESN